LWGCSSSPFKGNKSWYKNTLIGRIFLLFHENSLMSFSWKIVWQHFFFQCKNSSFLYLPFIGRSLMMQFGKVRVERERYTRNSFLCNIPC
jgi:hypothetical protein